MAAAETGSFARKSRKYSTFGQNPQSKTKTYSFCVNNGVDKRKSVFTHDRMSKIVQDFHGQPEGTTRVYNDRRRTMLGERVNAIGAVNSNLKKIGFAKNGPGKGRKLNPMVRKTICFVTDIPTEVVEEMEDDGDFLAVAILAVLSCFFFLFGMVGVAILIDVEVKQNDGVTFSIGECVLISFSMIAMLNFAQCYGDLVKEDTQIFLRYALPGVLMGVGNLFWPIAVSLLGSPFAYVLCQIQFFINLALGRVIFGEVPTTAMVGSSLIIVLLCLAFRLNDLLEHGLGGNVGVGIIMAVFACSLEVIADLFVQSTNSTYTDLSMPKKLFFLYTWVILGVLLAYLGLNVEALDSRAPMEGFNTNALLLCITYVITYNIRIIAIMLTRAVVIQIIYIALIVVVFIINATLLGMPVTIGQCVTLTTLIAATAVFQLETPSRDIVEELFENEEGAKTLPEKNGLLNASDIALYLKEEDEDE